MQQLGLILLLVLSGAGWAQTAGAAGALFSPAAIRTVTKLADSNDGVCNSDCSLRDAIAVAVSGDNINSQPLSMARSLYKNLSIDRGGVMEISGNNAVQIIDINSGTVTLDALTLRNGNAGSGGAITNDGNLTISRSTLKDNVSTGTGGGAIFSGVTLTVFDGTFSGNSANLSSDFGGAIRSTGSGSQTPRDARCQSGR